MPISEYLLSCIKREAFLCYERRVAAGAHAVSSPEDEKRDWEVGKKEAVRQVGLLDLCLRVMNCTDPSDKIRLAVMFFVADTMGLSVDEVNDETPLPDDIEERITICRKASYAATNCHFVLMRSAQLYTASDLALAISDSWQRLNRGI